MVPEELVGRVIYFKERNDGTKIGYSDGYYLITKFYEVVLSDNYCSKRLAISNVVSEYGHCFIYYDMFIDNPNNFKVL